MPRRGRVQPGAVQRGGGSGGELQPGPGGGAAGGGGGAQPQAQGGVEGSQEIRKLSTKYSLQSALCCHSPDTGSNL